MTLPAIEEIVVPGAIHPPPEIEAPLVTPATEAKVMVVALAAILASLTTDPGVPSLITPFNESVLVTLFVTPFTTMEELVYG